MSAEPRVQARNVATSVGAAVRDTVTPAGRVLQVLRRTGPATRTQLAEATGFSVSTVNRIVGELFERALVRDRTDLAPKGRVGRPHVPLDLDDEKYLTVGVHLGVRSIRVVAGDLRADVLAVTEFPTPDDPVAAFGAVASEVRNHLRAYPRRSLLRAGLAVGGRLDRRTGILDHRHLGWSGVPVAELFAAAVPAAVGVAAHVDALADVEYRALERAGSGAPPPSYLYFYARETIACAWVVDGVVRSPDDGPGTVAHLPTGSGVPCGCGRIGCLEVTVADRTLVAAAERDGVLGRSAAARGIDGLHEAADAGSAGAAALLTARATHLGRAVALVRDLVNPDVVALGGQSFTAYPSGQRHIRDEFERRTALPVVPLRFSCLGDGTQSAAALSVGLAAVYADPFGVARPAIGIGRISTEYPLPQYFPRGASHDIGQRVEHG